MKLSKSLKDSAFFSTYTALLKNKRFFSFSIALDVVFLVVFLNTLAFIASFSQRFAGSVSAAIFFVLFYCVIGVLLYSVVKFFVLRTVGIVFHRYRLVSKSFLPFFFLNVLLFFALFFLYVLIANFAQSFRDSLTVFTSGIFTFIFVVVAYVFVNSCHTYFLRTQRLQKLFSSSFRFLGSIKSWIGIVIIVGFIFAPIMLLFLAVGTGLEKTLFLDPYYLGKYFTTYNTAFSVVVSIGFLICLSFNRFYFYSVIDVYQKKRNT